MAAKSGWRAKLGGVVPFISPLKRLSTAFIHFPPIFAYLRWRRNYHIGPPLPTQYKH
jgi:hypothetical protein